MRDHRIAECGGFSKLIVEQAKAEGIEARHVFGLLASQPYGTGHYWAEFKVGDEWVAIDPLMIMLLQRHAGLPKDQWPLYRPLAGTLLPLSVIEGYDSHGAPILVESTHKQFFKYPVVSFEKTGFPLSITINTQEV